MIKVETRPILAKVKTLTPKLIAAIKREWPDVTRIVAGKSIGDGVFNVVVHFDDEFVKRESVK